MSDLQKDNWLRSALLAGIAAISLVGFQAYALAQDADDDDEEEVTEVEDEAILDRIQVTGSLLRRDEFTSASPIQVITADTAVTLGQVDTAEFLQRSSVAQGSTQFNNQFGGFVIQGGTGVQTLSLRGLGAQRTLVVLNNRRPGASGTRGQVGAFDLNVIPSSIIQRAEILKDGASSIYGSDAVAGVVNVITRRSVDRPELTVRATVPFESGGETYDISGAYGWNFERGSIVAAAEWQLRSALRRGDRDFLRCSEDYFFNAAGDRIDREDRSVNQGTDLDGCQSAGIINAVDDLSPFTRYVPSPDGSTVGLIPGYRPRTSTGEFYDEVFQLDLHDQQMIANRTERFSFYAASDFDLDLFGGTRWNTEFLYTRRETFRQAFRQFFPVVADGAFGFYTDTNVYDVPVPSGLARPIIPYPFDTEVVIDYYYLATGLEGDLPFGNWSWQADTSYSYSDGDYTNLIIQQSRTGDIQRGGLTAPPIDYFSPGILDGSDMDQIVAALGRYDKGNTVYDQFVGSFLATGDIFDLPAGPIGLALGAEYRWFSIDDLPGPFTLDNDSWGLSGAGRTKGSDNVIEGIGEIEIPLLAGKPFAEFVSLNMSGRVFDYDSAGSDTVWKTGLNWQVNPSIRLRGTTGTSYRAPALFELFLEDQTGFFSQLADPCVNWGESTNEFIRANCAADGVPPDYQAAGTSSGTIVVGGGAGRLESETSTASTAGMVLTPTFMDISIAIDYFEIEVQDQITQLGASAVLSGCYNAANFPNAFCDQIDRVPPGDTSAPGEHAIREVRSGYVNINQQENRGVDVTIRYDRDFSFGRLVVETQKTWTIEDKFQFFDPDQVDGFDDFDRNGTIGNPKFVANGRAALSRGDWTFTYFTNYIRRTSQARFIDEETTYFGQPAVRVIKADRRWYHGFSALYRSDNWSVLGGIDNIFNTAPPNVSAGVVTRYGTVPAFATQYPLRGRTGYLRFNYMF